MNSRSTGQTAHINRMCDTSADHLLFLTILLTHLMDHVIFYNPTLSREEIQHFLGARCPINTLNTACSSLTLNVLQEENQQLYESDWSHAQSDSQKCFVHSFGLT